MATVLSRTDEVSVERALRGIDTLRSVKARFHVTLDPDTKIVTCRILGQICEADAAILSAELGETIAAARRHNPVVRLLFDNRFGASFGSSDQAEIRELRRSACRPADRIAMLVSTCLQKTEARKNHDGQREVFLSESAALTWLTAWG